MPTSILPWLKIRRRQSSAHTLSWLLCALKSHYAHASNSAFEALPSLHSDDPAKSSGVRHTWRCHNWFFLKRKPRILLSTWTFVTSTKGLKTLVCHDFFHFLRVGFLFFIFYFFILSINLYISPLLHLRIKLWKWHAEVFFHGKAFGANN